MIIDDNSLSTTDAIAWGGYVAGIDKDLSYSDEYQQLISQRQFSFLLRDHSLIQVVYLFRAAAELKKVRLAYHPPPHEASIDGAPIDAPAEEWGTRLSHLRLDYAPEATTHAKSHLQVSGLPAIRVPLDVVVGPYLFLDFVVAAALPTEDAKWCRGHARYGQALAHARRTVAHVEEFSVDHLYVTVSA